MKSQLITTFFIVCMTGCGSPAADQEPRENAGLGADSFCPVGALYDETEDVCYIECDELEDFECDALEESVFGEFDEYLIDNYNGAKADAFEAGNARALYQVEEDLTLTTIENTAPENDDKFREIWFGVKQILPRSRMMKAFAQYHVDSDGIDGTLAYVTQDDQQSGKWILAFDDEDYISPTSSEFIHTAIHEFGHVVFLGEDQLDSHNTEDCPNYGIDEGCSYEDSYINVFYQRFWIDISDEHGAIKTAEEEIEFYERYKDQFVSEYAATNPVEDAAEIFTNFILSEKPVSSNTIVDQKILLLHRIPSLVKLRRDIQGKLSIVRKR